VTPSPSLPNANSAKKFFLEKKSLLSAALGKEIVFLKSLSRAALGREINFLF
jgi:hypothetical protein